MITKELKAIIQSPKFVGSFAVCSILILVSLFTGVQEYRAAVGQYETATGLADQQLREATSWADLNTRLYREPEPMQVFVSGLSNDIGRWSAIGPSEGVKLRHSSYSDDPIFAVFRFIDFAFIVTFVLSLLAIQFTYNAVNGERESGTLRLIFANSVSRARYLIAKCIGTWVGLVVPLTIPILLGLLMVIGMGVPLSGDDWTKLLLMLGLALLLLTFFILLGVLVSTLTRRSSVSFLLALLVWVTLVMIVPRAGVMAAGGLTEVPTLAEMEARQEAYATERWNQFYTELSTGQLSHNDTTSSAQIDSLHDLIQGEIDDYEIRLQEDLRQRRSDRDRAAWSLARISPPAAFQLAAMKLAATDTRAKDRYEETMTDYRRNFNEYTEAKSAEAGQTGGIRISVTMEDGGVPSLTVDASRDRAGLDISDVPRYAAPDLSLAETVAPVVIDFALLVFAVILTFVLAFIAFLRYDVR